MQHYDVCVIGAGIAGSTLALALSKSGYNVFLIEKQSFPRFHIGCSFSPGVVTHWALEFGINDILSKSIIQEKQKIEVSWESDQPIFKEENGCLVDRGLFDDLLIEKCIQHNVKVVFSNSTQFINHQEKGWEISFEEIKLSAKILVEATGRKSSVIKTGKDKYLPKLLAVYGFLNLNTQNPQINSGKNYWVWTTPYRDKTLTVIYSNPNTITSLGGLQSFYEVAVKNTFDYSITQEERLTLKSCDATANVDLSPIGNNYIKIGDAAFTVDPLSSQGVAKAFKSASHAVRIVHTMLQKPYLIADLIHFYTTAIGEEVENNKKWTLDYYQAQARFKGDFWNQYYIDITESALALDLGLDDELIINPDLKIKKTGIVGHEFIEFKEAFFLGQRSFSYANALYIPSIIIKINGLRIIEILDFLHNTLSKQESMHLLRFFVENKLLLRRMTC